MAGCVIDTGKAEIKMHISINAPDYESWDLYNESNEIVATHADPGVYAGVINPINQRLFHKDVLRIDIETKTVERVSSQVQLAAYIPGVLLLENNKTFGRTETKKKLLYRCIPDDKHLPVFLLPYEVRAGFSKVHINKYVLFKFHHWEDKHPRGLLTETIGDVSELPGYYEYRMYCKQIHTTISGLSKTTNRLCSSSTEEHLFADIHTNPAYRIENREQHRIISIDPAGSLDIDDAFGIEPVIMTAGEQTGWVLSIYIANVFVWIEHLKLWDSLSDRVSTIYLPDHKRPMLPPILSDNYCSLLQNKLRFAFTLDIPMDINGTIDEANVKLVNTSIRVFKNYAYGESKLLKEPVYTTLMRLSKNNNLAVQTSHDLVEHMMICMNTLTAKMMLQNECGIFRKMAFERTPVLDTTLLPTANAETIRVMNSWNNVVGGYVNYSTQEDISHHLLHANGSGVSTSNNNQHYVHITSPIRRLVDLLNQITLSSAVALVSAEASAFLAKWQTNIETINMRMKSTRKLQYECELLHKCTTDDSICNDTHTGYIVDAREGANHVYKYTVYLPGLKLFGVVRCEVAYAKYSEHRFSIYMFHDSDTIVKKIRLQLLQSVVEARPADP